jgi:glyoxylase-like metal-dependent hydrolase (beta-lactamase superfamily II)/8-oxo-dGTP pyrophosphatase MutT (NUDIX family)
MATSSADPSPPVRAGSSAAATVERPPRPSATIVVVREGERGIEVLLCRRAERGDHNSGAWVFPGGLVDAGDRAAHACCAGLDDAAASERLRVGAGGLDFYVAAIRECFEESGLLYAVDAATGGAVVDLDEAAAAQVAPWRIALHRGERTLVDFCRDTGLALAVDRLVYLSHWITPVGRAKRFDTRFFLAVAPRVQTALHDGTEMVEQQWLRPADALLESAALKLLTPTQKTLELLARYPNVEALLEWARARREIVLTMPRAGTGRDGVRPVLPDEPAWAELGRIDPHGRADQSYDINPGVPVRLSPRVIRVSAGNGSMMTGPGTNSYLVGGGTENEWALIDPGPLMPDHVEAVLAAAPGPIRWIFATHTHPDHSPATLPLKARTGAVVHGLQPTHPQWQDATFDPDVVLRGGERLALPGGTTLRAIHTPGHASNHLCYLLEEEKTLFTGDHVMQLSTVVINPPDGDMAAYLASLRALLAEDIEWLAPGHGFLMGEPQRAIEAIIAHRLKREAKVVGAMRAHPDATPEALLAAVYDDVPERLHPMAMRSLTAHLHKLRSDGAARELERRWALVEPSGH